MTDEIKQDSRTFTQDAGRCPYCGSDDIIDYSDMNDGDPPFYCRSCGMDFHFPTFPKDSSA